MSLVLGVVPGGVVPLTKLFGLEYVSSLVEGKGLESFAANSPKGLLIGKVTERPDGLLGAPNRGS